MPSLTRVLLSGLLSLPCGACATPSSAARATPSTAAQAGETPAGSAVAGGDQTVSGSCKAFGPLACDAKPAAWKDPCKQLASCIEKLGDADSKQPVFVYQCGEPQRLSLRESAAQVAALRVDADQGERFHAEADADFMSHPHSGSAAFLLGQHADGWCLIDQLSSWDWDTMGRVEDEFEARVEPGTQDGVVVVTQHASRLELDEDEREEGVDDLRYASCTEQHFKFTSGHYERVRSKSDDGLCPSLGGQ